MKINIHHYHHYPEIEQMSQNMQRLIDEVAQTRTVAEGAVTLIKDLRQRIIDAGTDEAKLAELADSLDLCQGALTAALTEGTAAAEEPAPPAPAEGGEVAHGGEEPPLV
jgi:hypothetical protein